MTLASPCMTPPNRAATFCECQRGAQPDPREAVRFLLLFSGDRKNCRLFLTLAGSILQVARTLLTRSLAIGNMRLGEQGANCRHAPPAAGGATETSVRLRGRTRARAILALEHAKDLDVREDIAGADDHEGPTLLET